MHGEFKVPGGKLVVVDLDVVDGRISDFRLAGDFFLEPDEALDAIDAAVNGLPVETDARALAAAVQAALPADAQLLGLHARVGGDRDPPRPAEGDQLARLRLAARAPRPAEPAHAPGPRRGARRRRSATAPASPTLRIWEWDEPAVVIGSFQSVKNEVDPENAEKYGFQVVRRISGGGAMFMDAGSRRHLLDLRARSIWSRA